MLPFATCGLLEKIVTCPRTLSYLPLLRVSETVTIAMNPNPIAAGQPTAGPIASVEPNHETELAAEEIVEQLHSAEVPPEPRPFMHMVLGRPLETAAAPHQTIGKTIGLAVFASDALSSVAYATQEILLVLAAAGAI
jgi:hypothetical protein